MRWRGTLLFLASLVAGKDLYKILNVPRNAQVAEIKRAYRRMSMQYHPDRNKGDATASAKFAEISEAYEILSDSRTRADYDRLGYERFKEVEAGGGGGGEDMHDAFFDFFGFGGGGARRNSAAAKSPPVQFRLPVTLSQLYFGDLLQISFERPVLCLRADDCYDANPACSGPGTATATQSFGNGFILQKQIEDASCVAPGKRWKPNCRACPKGPTEMHRSKTSIFVERGAASGDILTFENGGVQQLGQQPGDVQFTITQLPHPAFERVGDDLKTHMFITLREALVGFKRTVTHLNRKPLVVEMTDVVHDAQVKVFKRLGMPKRDSTDQFGDLYIHFHVEFPQSLNSEQVKLLDEALKDVSAWKMEPLRV